MDEWRDRVVPVRFGLALGMLAVLYGWGLGVVFGAAEDWLRRGFLADAEAHRQLYLDKVQGDPEAATALIKRMDETCWRYFQRAHLHAGGIGSVAIGASLVLAFLSASPAVKLAASTLLGVGSIGYPLFWMLAALRAPSLGATGLAKESLGWLAIPSAGALVLGGAATALLVVRDLLLSRSSKGAAG